MSCAQKKKENLEILESLGKLIIKSVTLVFSVFCIIIAKNHFMNENATLFHLGLCAVIVSVIFTVIGLVDNYIFTNLAVGLGIGIAMELTKFN